MAKNLNLEDVVVVWLCLRDMAGGRSVRRHGIQLNMHVTKGWKGGERPLSEPRFALWVLTEVER